MDIDSALATVGGWRRWNIAVFSLLSVSTWIPLCWQGLAIVFIGWTPPHNCKINSSRPTNETIPYKDGTTELEECLMYSIDHTAPNITSPCIDGLVYHDNGYTSVVSEWDLVCENNYLSNMSQTIFEGGCLLAELCIAYLVDRLGRRNIHVIAHIYLCVMGIGLAFTQSFVTFVVMRVLVGFGVVGAGISGITMMMELFDSSRRATAGICMEFGWVLLYLLMPGIAYLIQDWRWFQASISICSGVWVIYYWLLPESPAWLESYRKYDKAEKILNSIAQKNKVQTIKLDRGITYGHVELNRLTCETKHEDSTDIVEENIKETFEVNIKSSENKARVHVPVSLVFKDPILRKFVIISCLFWFTNALVYYGIVLSSPTLAGDRFINFILLGLVEIPAYASSAILVNKIGRRWPLFIFHIIAGVPLMVTTFVPKTTASGSDLSWLVIVLVIIAKFGISGSFAVMILLTKEIIPTKLRGTCGGFNTVCGRLGSMTAPMAAFVSLDRPWIPNTAFTILSLGTGICVFLLPETLNKPLPQTVHDIYTIFYSTEKKLHKHYKTGDTNEKNG